VKDHLVLPAIVLVLWAAACHAEPFAYFVDRAAGSLTAIDVGTNQVLPAIDVRHHPISVAAVPVGHAVYVGNEGEPDAATPAGIVRCDAALHPRDRSR